MDIKKHVGKTLTDDQDCIVVFRQILDDKGNVSEDDQCLVVNINAIAHPFNHELGSIVDSEESQTEVELWKVLSRKSFQNGRNILQALHTSGNLKKVATKDVMMSPSPAHTILLSVLNENIQYAQSGSTPPPTEGATVPTVSELARNQSVDVTADLSKSTEEMVAAWEYEVQYLTERINTLNEKIANHSPKPAADSNVKPVAKPSKTPAKRKGSVKKPVARGRPKKAVAGK